MQGFSLASAAVPEQQHECNASFCFKVPDSELQRLAGSLQETLSKDEVSALHTAVHVPESAVSTEPVDNGPEPIPDRPDIRGPSNCNDTPVLRSDQAQLQQPEPVSETSKKSASAPDEEQDASGVHEATMQRCEPINIPAWFWAGNRAAQSIPKLPRCRAFTPPTPAKSPQRINQARSAWGSPANNKPHGTQSSGAAGPGPGAGRGTGFARRGVGDGKVPWQGKQDSYRRGYNTSSVPSLCSAARPLQPDNNVGQKKKKKRCGRFVRELAETEAAERDNKVELGFNANLKQFEKSQRDKGVFQNQRKRSTVYTVSGALAHDNI